MNLLTHLKQTIVPPIVTVVVGCLAFMPQMQAVSPTPDGCYPNFTTAEGCNALKFLTTGAGNTALGWRSLFLDSTGNFNTGVGAGTLVLNTGDSNTAVGAAALLLNTTGVNNTAVGGSSLLNNDDGGGNTAMGVLAVSANIHGNSNTGLGFGALQNNDDSFNTAVGAGAISQDTIGAYNTAVGSFALQHDVLGGANTAVGSGALANALTDFNTALGGDAGSNVVNAHDVICIGIGGADISDSCFIGNIRDVTTDLNDAVPVLIDSVGQLGTVNSSRRFKTDIQPMDKASESILALQPVSFRYKVHRNGPSQYGLIAEDVAEVNRDLVIYDSDGKPQTVRYEAVNAMLLNEFLKEHRKTEKLEATVVRQQKQIEALTAGLQRVSAQLELNKSAPQTVVNND